MIDLEKLKSNFGEIAKRMFYRGIDSEQLSKVIQKNEQRKELISVINNLRSRRNKLSSEKIKNNSSVSRTREEIRTLEGKLQEVVTELRELHSQLPNIPAPGTPSNEEGNLVRREFWSRRKVNNSLSYEKIMEKLAITDEKSAVEITASKFVIYKDLGVSLLHSLVTFMLVENRKKGYRLVSTPYLANSTSLYNTGQLPKFTTDLFKLESSNLVLIPTSEVTLVNLYANKMIDPKQLPVKLCSYSPCFRAEAGAAGQENKGLIRLHQFHKVELVKITEPENSYAELELLANDATSLLEQLGVSYRVIDLCYKELGVSAAKTYDIEA